MPVKYGKSRILSTEFLFFSNSAYTSVATKQAPEAGGCATGDKETGLKAVAARKF